MVYVMINENKMIIKLYSLILFPAISSAALTTRCIKAKKIYLKKKCLMQTQDRQYIHI